MTLLHRIETACPDQQRELLAEAFSTIWPQVASGAWDAIDAWYARQDAFDAMLDAGAYLSAAEMLVPEGWDYSASREHTRGSAYIVKSNADFQPEYTASTPALALLAAILRAREAQSVQPT